ncbi:putative cystathionine gamma-synthase [Helianthus annuus]|nr:putative cystathionine gamma-synthase [Helianthus annuus]
MLHLGAFGAGIAGLESALNNHKVSISTTSNPTSPFLRCVDIELVSKLCHAKGAVVCIDGTFATPLNQKALVLGACIILHSATKYLGGHNDMLAGCISGWTEIIFQVHYMHHVLGGTLNPNAAYLIIRGMKTLKLRVQQQNSIGGVVSFEVDGDITTTIKFVDSLKIPYIAPSFGGCESIMDQRAIMSYWDLSQAKRAKYGILDNLVRFSFGDEDYEDLEADVLKSLEAI